jgi:hypothetical protein
MHHHVTPQPQQDQESPLCPNPIVTCAACQASIEGCTCRWSHRHSTVPVCGGCGTPEDLPSRQRSQHINRQKEQGHQ